MRELREQKKRVEKWRKERFRGKGGRKRERKEKEKQRRDGPFSRKRGPVSPSLFGK
jgi:hypothetical protein